MNTANLKRTEVVLHPDRKRVLLRPFLLSNAPPGAMPGAPLERALRICASITALPESEVRALWKQVKAEFGERHTKTQRFLLSRFEQVRPLLKAAQRFSEERALLLGAYFTHEFSLEAAALFNPSMVPHPDQSDLAPGSLRFVLSLRATGEGHISSVTFRTGTLDAE